MEQHNNKINNIPRGAGMSEIFLQIPIGSIQIPIGSIPIGSIQIPIGSIQITIGSIQIPIGSIAANIITSLEK